jgi:hypothetical protein
MPGPFASCKKTPSKIERDGAVGVGVVGPLAEVSM